MTARSKTESEIVAEKVAALVGTEPLTMYKAAGIMSTVLGRKVREQMLYNYRAKKLIRTNEAGRVEADVFVAFLVKRIEKQNLAD
jgi:hypothetical protein